MTSVRSRRRWFLGALACLVVVTSVSFNATTAHADDAALASQVDATQAEGVAYLRIVQAEDGSWTSPQQPGITALVTTALLRSGVPADDPMIVKALSHLESFQQDDGGIYHAQSQHRNYETAITIMALEATGQSQKYNKTISRAVGFLKGLQWDESEEIDVSDPAYGGAGYGKHQRPDLSNTQYMLEAFKAAGIDESDPAYQKALIFISRCQNLETPHNNTEFAAKVDDGGFYYTPAAGGTSQAGTTPDGGLRSYASMTYAGLKSMIYAGVEKDDQRVKAATEWIRKFYTLEENPGMGHQGLFYYYHTFAKALDALEVAEFEDADGAKHNWRAELAAHLIKLQQSNGSWVNQKEDRWYEGNPHLATAYALLALSYCDSE